MGVEHTLNVGPRLVDLAVNVALKIGRAIVRRLAVEIETLDVVDGYQARSKLLRQEEALGILGVTGTDVPERIHDAFVQKDLRRRDQLFEDRLVRWAVVFHFQILPLRGAGDHFYSCYRSPVPRTSLVFVEADDPILLDDVSGIFLQELLPGRRPFDLGV